MRNLESLFKALARSSFRASFALKGQDIIYLQDKGLALVMLHAQDFIEKRLAPAQPLNDGKQTPMRGHPVFVAQHATALCCRGCFQQWHGIVQGVALSQAQQAYCLSVLQHWLEIEQQKLAQTTPYCEAPRQSRLW